MFSSMNSRRAPLFVDLDGTLVASNCALELLFLRVKRRPQDLLKMPYWFSRGRSYLKARLADDDSLDVSLLPYREDFCAYLRAERADQRLLYLATAADSRIAHRIAAHLGFFEGVLASDSNVNLKGIRKLAAIMQIADSGFTYAGDSSADLPIWAAAESAILVNAPSYVLKRLSAEGKVERIFASERCTLQDIIGALRAHQWLKNLLVFVPLLTSFRFSQIVPLLHSVGAFLAFSSCASATYVLNDLFDLASDRAHHNKRNRPFAAGRLSIPTGLQLALVAIGCGLGLAAWQSPELLSVTLGYIMTTVVYSLYLKKRVLMDVIVLAGLYIVRVFAGAVAIRVAVSVWLLAFAFFVFLSLALVKRCSELVALRSAGVNRARGRDYGVPDLQILWPMGVATAVCSILVFALYINSGDMPTHYRRPYLLWLVAVGLFYWLGRMWIKTSRGEMNDDPLVYAIRNNSSRIVIAAMIVVTIAAYF
jgi:4-hydroxybenzoate polyprenyltransferase/phosphoserine phosphatase